MEQIHSNFIYCYAFLPRFLIHCCFSLQTLHWGGGVEALFLQHTILCPTMDTNTFVSSRIKRKLDLRVAGQICTQVDFRKAAPFLHLNVIENTPAAVRTNVTFVSSMETMSRSIFIIYQKNFQFYSTTIIKSSLKS